MMQEEEKGRIQKLNEELYSRTRYSGPEDRRAPISSDGERNPVGEKWKAPELDEMLRYERRAPEGWSLTKRLFVFALVFFLCAVGAAAYIYLGGGNFVSSKNVDISVNGPVTVSAGDDLNLGIVITNKNNADLETADLSIRFPDGTRDPVDSVAPLTYQKTSLGVIKSGEQFSTSTSAIIYGEKGETKDITIDLEYTVKGSNATFSKEKVYEVSIGTTPVSMTVSQPNTTVSGDVFTTTVSVVSNSTQVLKNVLVQGEYPYGFAVTDTSPSATNDAKNLWDLGDMAPGDKKTITVKGKLTGQDGEERTFRFASGVASGDSTDRFDTLATAEDTISINRPDIDVELSLNGENSGDYSAPAGHTIQGQVKYQNNLTENLDHAQVVLKFSGAALDRFSIVPQSGGFYDSTNNQIVWSESTNPELASVAPGGSGYFAFQFASLATLPAGASQEIGLASTLTGTPTGSQSLSVNDSRTVKIGSRVSLDAAALFSKGPFKNTGPVPPKAEKATTYTIAMTMKDTQNDISNPKVTATLGSNVKWLGATSPAGESINYNDNSRTVTWSSDKLASGTGFSSPAKVIYFQVSLTPSIGQIGSIPVLVSNITFSGQDVFTNTPVNLTDTAVTTRFDTDPKFVQGDEIVVK